MATSTWLLIVLACIIPCSGLGIDVAVQSCVMSSDGEIIQEGTINVTIKCSCKGKAGLPLRKSKWLFPEKKDLLQEDKVEDGLPYYVFEDDEFVSTLIFPVFNSTYSGKYTCKNQQAVSSVNLHLPKRPAIEPQMMNRVHLENDTAAFLCHATGIPIPSVQWSFNGVQLQTSPDKYIVSSSIQMDKNSIVNTLIIFNIQSSDVGTYTCNASNFVDFDVSSGVLTVNVKPNITPETVILHRNVIEGDSIYITCSATGSPPPHIAWRIPQGSKRISLDPVEVISIGVGNITSVTRRLQIYQISRNDSGSYRCSATNYLGNDKHSIVLNVQFHPELTVFPISSTVIAGSKINFTCIVNGNPRPTLVEWWSNRIMLYAPVLILNDTAVKSILQRNNVQSHTAAGEYHCSSFNSVGSTRKTVTLIVHVSPVAEISPPSWKVYVYETVTFMCNATGIPRANIHWMRKPRKSNFKSDPRITITTSESGNCAINSHPSECVLYSKLQIANVLPSDRANYICRANNKAGVSHSYGKLSVTIPCPVIVQSPTSVQADLLQNITFNCYATGYEVKYNWVIRNTGLITDKVIGANTSTLMIPKVKSTDSDSYCCRATTRSCVRKECANLIVTGLPEVTVTPSRQMVEVTHIAVFTANASGVGVENFAYIWFHNKTVISGQSNSDLILNGVTENSNGKYRCIVSNLYGDTAKSFSAKLIVQVKPPENITINPSPLFVALLNDARLTCLAMGYKVRYDWTVEPGYGSFPYKVTGINTNELVIPEVKSSDEKVYLCTAYNQGGSITTRVRLIVTGLPEVIVTPSSQCVEVTTTTVFYTTVSGVGMKNFSYQWWHNGNRIENGKRKYLYIYDVAENDSGNYRCIVTNQCGDSSESGISVLFTTRNPPNITLHPMNAIVYLVNNITNFTLECKADGASSYNWERRFDGYLSQANTSNFTLFNLKPENVGYYRCKATNASGSSYSYYAELTIQVLPPALTQLPEDVITPYNTTAIFKCVGQGYGYVIVTWEKRGTFIQHLPSKVLIDTTYTPAHDIVSTLTIPNVQDSDVGAYQCVYSNSVGEAHSNIAKLIRGIPRPILIKHPQHELIELKVNNYNITLCCQADGYNLKYMWTKDGIPVVPDSHYVITEQGLTIVNVKPSDRGQYQCIVTNSAGIVRSDIATMIIFATGPFIITHPTDTSAGAPFSGVFSCSAGGYGSLSIEWKRKDADLPQSSNVTQLSLPNVTTSTLAIQNVTEGDEGIYFCICWIGKQSSKSNTAILYYGPPKCLPEVLIPTPFVCLNTSNFNISILCNCKSPGDTHSYAWERKDGELPKGSRGGHSSNFTIINLRPQDSGEYRCVIFNSTGRIASNYTLLTVKGSPVITYLNSSIVSVEGEKVTLTCVATNNFSSADQLNVEWYDKNGVKVISNGTYVSVYSDTNIVANKLQSFLTFNSVNRSNHGEYTCRVYNHPKKYDEARANLIVEFPPDMTILYVSPPPDATMILLYCISEARPVATVQWYKNDIPFGYPGIATKSIVIPLQSLLNSMYTCEGKNKVGNMIRVVKEKFSIQIHSVQLKCPTLSDLTNGRVLYIDNGNTAVFICNSGYSVTGNVIATCVSGTWSAQPPMCMKL